MHFFTGKLDFVSNILSIIPASDNDWEISFTHTEKGLVQEQNLVVHNNLMFQAQKKHQYKPNTFSLRDRTQNIYTAQKMKFSIKSFFSKFDHLLDLVKFTKKIFHGKFHFLYTVNYRCLKTKIFHFFNENSMV